MSYNFSPFKSAIAEVEAWLSKELTQVRTGRATPVLLDSVQVESYGSYMPVAHVAAISTPDPRSLLVTPWDKSQLKGIESAIQAANLGLGISSDGVNIRVTFPELTSERRTVLAKLIREKLEEARVRLRGERETVWNDIQAKEKEGELSEDDKFRGKEALQKLVDEANTKLEGLAEKKTVEISE